MTPTRQMTQRAYQTSHPWISFSLNLDGASPRLWALLGQAVAFCEQVSGAVLTPPAAQELYRTHLVRGARATTAIENNTLTEEQVRGALDGTLDLPPSQEYLGQEVVNILDAYNGIRDQIEGGNAPRLTREWVADANRAVLKELDVLLPEGVVPGEVPTFVVGVGRYRGAPREDCDYLLDRLCRWLDEDDVPGPWTRAAERGASRSGPSKARDDGTPADVAGPPDKGAPANMTGRPDAATPAGNVFQDDRRRRMAEGILKATLAHLYIAWIHPYGDGNGRTARLVEFMLLARAGIPFPSAHLMSDHFNLTRNRYYRELDRSSRVSGRAGGSDRGDAFGFVEYAVRGFVDGLAEQCRYVEDVQMALAWEHFVFHRFRQERQTEAAGRRREVVLALSHRDEPVRKRRVLSLTPEVARMYAEKTYKTLTRDLNWLVDADLVARGPEGYRARKEQMKAFRDRGD